MMPHQLEEFIKKVSSTHKWKFSHWGCRNEGDYYLLHSMYYVCEVCNAHGEKGDRLDDDFIMAKSRRTCAERVMRDIMK